MEATTSSLLVRPVDTRLSAASLPIVVRARRRVAVVTAAAPERKPAAAASSSNYVVVPLDAAPSGITRPLVEILRDLNKRVPDTVVRSSRRRASPSDPVIPWYGTTYTSLAFACATGKALQILLPYTFACNKGHSRYSGSCTASTNDAQILTFLVAHSQESRHKKKFVPC